MNAENENRFSRNVINNNLSEALLLMHKDTPVVRFNINSGFYEVLEPRFVPYALREGFRVNALDERRGNSSFIRDTDRNEMLMFLSHRVLSLTRSNAKKMYNAYNISQREDVFSRARIAIACRAVSVEDCYWLKTEGTDMRWEDVNLRINSLSEVVANIMLHGKSLTLQGKAASTPEFTNNGTSAMAWKRESGKLFLHKKSRNESKSAEKEVCISRILDCFNVPHVRYEKVDATDNTYECRCLNMCDEDLERIPAADIFSYCNHTGRDFERFIVEIGGSDIYKMCILDYLISNSDRHIINWGFYQDSNTGELIGMHPMFDHDNAFDPELHGDSGWESQIFEGKTAKFIAKATLEKSNLRCLKPVIRDMFPTRGDYDDFMEKACELGLYRKRDLSALEKIQKKLNTKTSHTHSGACSLKTQYFS